MSYLKEPFWKSMSWTYNGEKVVDPNWNLIENIYNNFEYKKNQIPKIIHQIWLGSDLPKKYLKLIKSFKQFNPDWEYVLWTDENTKDLDLKNREIFDRQTNMGSKSDILRYEILQKYGGVYFDTDFECLKSFNDLIGCSFFCGTFYDNKIKSLPNGLIGSTPDNPILLDLISGIRDVKYENEEVLMNTTGPNYFGKIVLKHFLEDNKDDIVIFPTIFFYPIPSSTRYEISGIHYEDLKHLLEINDRISYTIHYFHVSWKFW